MVLERSGSGDIERTLALLWGTEPEDAGRGPRRSLTVAAIVDAAIEIADAEGLDAVSMRSVAAALDVGTMTLYRYLPGKAELLDLMLDKVNRPQHEALPTDWRAALEVCAEGLWELYTTHRWLPLVDQARPLLGPNVLVGLDLFMGTLCDTALTDQEKIALMVAVDAFAASHARMANAMVDAEQRTGVSDEEFWDAQESALEAAMASGRYPHMAELDESSFDMSAKQTFDFGLARMLDGVAAMVAERQ